MSKRFALVSLMCLFALFCLGAVSLKSNESVNSFDSIPMLSTYYDETLPVSEAAFYDQCTVSLLTLSKGDALYSWFGHAGILVEAPNGLSVVYDYGTFSFSEDDFFLNFAFGRLWFCCYSTFARYELANADAEGRSVSKVVLPLTAEQKKAVISFLDVNSDRDHRTYLYHHYNDNCATRLRDIIDYTTGGDFQAWAKAQPGQSYRKQASRALSQNRFVLWALNLLQSGNIDKSATLWDEMFLPEILEKAVMDYYGLESSLIVDNEDSYKHSPGKAQSNIGFSIVFGLVLGYTVIVLSLFRKRKAMYIVSGVVDVIFGLVGTVLFFMMFFTNHDVTWLNENVLFVNPLLIVLAVFAFLSVKKDRVVFEKTNLVGLCIIAALVVLKLVFGRAFSQQNWDIISTMVIWYGCCFAASRLSNRKNAKKH